MKKYTYYRFALNKGGFGFKDKNYDYTFVHNNENDQWFAVYRGQSVSGQDNKSNWRKSENSRVPFSEAVKAKNWIPYSRRPRQVLP